MAKGSGRGNERGTSGIETSNLTLQGGWFGVAGVDMDRGGGQRGQQRYGEESAEGTGWGRERGCSQS